MVYSFGAKGSGRASKKSGTSSGGRKSSWEKEVPTPVA